MKLVSISIQFDQSGLGMSRKDYFYPRNKTALMAYEQMVYSTAVQMGAPDSLATRKDVKDVVDLELSIAEVIHFISV